MSNDHIRRITEISIAVEDLDKALVDLGGVLGLSYAEPTVEPEPPVQARFAGFYVPGSTTPGLMESTAENSPIARSLQRRGEGIFSISFEVDDVWATMGEWKAKGIEFVLEEPMVSNSVPVAGERWPTVRFNFTKPNPLLHGVTFEIQELQK